MEKLPPIPTPVGQRWREFRIQVLPLIIFLFVLLAVVILWRSFVQPSGIVGEVESIKADLISLQDGLLTRLDVDRFERVEAGQDIGELTSANDETLRTSIAAVEADLRVMEARIAIDQQRNEQSYHQMKLDIWKEQVALAGDKASLIQASNTFKRYSELLNQAQKIVSDDEYDIAKANFERLQSLVEQRTKSIVELTDSLLKLQPNPSPESQDSVEKAIKARIAELQESLKPVTLKAPMSGIISTIYHRAGEKVVKGVAILTVTAPNSDRVVGYLRQPIHARPTTNDTVVVRTRSTKRQIITGAIERVGSQMELINPALLSTDGNRVEVGLPILVRLPEKTKLVPGEFVDVTIQYAKR